MANFQIWEQEAGSSNLPIPTRSTRDFAPPVDPDEAVETARRGRVGVFAVSRQSNDEGEQPMGHHDDSGRRPGG